MKILYFNTILILLILTDQLNFRTSDARIIKKFNMNNVPFDLNYYHTKEHKIRYLATGDMRKRMILFIHGAPGSLDAFLYFLKDQDLSDRFYMITVDRPGYGYSELGNAVPEVKKQADMIALLLRKNQNIKKPIIVGHSYGGTIAAKIAMDYPEETGGILLVGAATDPDHEKIFWISYIFKLPWLKWWLPPVWQVTNTEKLKHTEELRRLVPAWKLIKIPVTILHGEKDRIVPIENAYFSDNLIESTVKRLIIKKNAGHLIPWTNPEYMKEEIIHMDNNY